MAKKAPSSSRDRLTRLQAEAAAKATEKKAKKATKKTTAKKTTRRSSKSTEPGEGPRMKYVWRVQAGNDVVAEFAWPDRAKAEADAEGRSSESKTAYEVIKTKVPLD